MRYFLLFFLISVTVHLSVAPPVHQKIKDEKQNNEKESDWQELEYLTYLMEVGQLLENDSSFRAILENADKADIFTGKIADQLQFVDQNVRSKLDEIKRVELERLRRFATKENELKNGLDIEHLKIPEHLDHTNTRTFEIQDLKKLIAKTTKDLAEADRMRREKFKQHEMEKKYEEQEKLKHMNDIERKKYEQELQSVKDKHKKHDLVHHPGSKQQLEEVWEKQDHMETEEFNPRTFFFFHDLDGNGVWDQNEVKTLFLKELDKLYDQGAPQDDLLKRAEEMERMREHVFNEADLNKDGLISYEEFLEETKKPDFQEDAGWQALDEQQIYTQEEFEAFERHKQEEIQKKIAKGMLPPHPGSIAAQPESFPSQYEHAPAVPGVISSQVDSNQNVLHQQQFQDQIHPQYHQQPQIVVPQQQQQYHQNLAQQQRFQGQVPLNQQYQHMQVPQEQIPVQQLHSGAVPIQQHQEQIQVPQNIQNNAVPQQNNPIQSNTQSTQPPVQQEINKNSIPTGKKV